MKNNHFIRTSATSLHDNTGGLRGLGKVEKVYLDNPSLMTVVGIRFELLTVSPSGRLSVMHKIPSAANTKNPFIGQDLLCWTDDFT